MQSPRHRAGFTIVELLIVIVVIGILAAISIIAYSGIQERSRVASLQSDLRQLTQAITVARSSTNKTLLQITGSTDSRGTKALADAAIDKISLASGIDISPLKDGDPWGDYYRIDENEKESSPTDCRKDTITINSRTALSITIPSSQPPCL